MTCGAIPSTNEKEGKGMKKWMPSYFSFQAFSLIVPYEDLKLH